jgi:hypothetical protein
VLSRIERLMQGQEAAEEPEPRDEGPIERALPVPPEETTPTLSAPPLAGQKTPSAAAPDGTGAAESGPGSAPVAASDSVRHFELIGGSSAKILGDFGGGQFIHVRLSYFAKYDSNLGRSVGETCQFAAGQ